MRTGHRPAWRRRPQSRAARIAVPLAIPMALGLTLGAVLAFTGGPSSTAISQTAAGASASASPGATPSPSVSAASAAPTATATAPAAAAANVSCDIIVPANPLTAQGLSTPYQLTGTERAEPGRVRLHHGQLRQPGRVRPGHDPEPGHRRAVGVRAAGHHPGHAARRGPGRADAARERRRHHRLRLQRHQPDPGRRHPERAPAGQLRQRAARLDLRPGLVLQRHPASSRPRPRPKPRAS